MPAPIEWDELEDSCCGRMGSPIRDVPGRLARIGDRFRTAADLNQVLPDQPATVNPPCNGSPARAEESPR